jgi:hypothetical protein
MPIEYKIKTQYIKYLVNYGKWALHKVKFFMILMLEKFEAISSCMTLYMRNDGELRYGVELIIQYVETHDIMDSIKKDAFRISPCF